MCWRPAGSGGAGPSASLPLLNDAPASPASRSPRIRPGGAPNATRAVFQQPASDLSSPTQTKELLDVDLLLPGGPANQVFGLNPPNERIFGLVSLEDLLRKALIPDDRLRVPPSLAVGSFFDVSEERHEIPPRG